MSWLQDEDPEAIPAFADVIADIVGRSKVAKAGEGTFKEVFKCGSSVVAVMPIEGDVVMNDEPQKCAEACIGEVLANLHLAELREPTPSCGGGGPDSGSQSLDSERARQSNFGINVTMVAASMYTVHMAHDTTRMRRAR